MNKGIVLFHLYLLYVNTWQMELNFAKKKFAKFNIREYFLSRLIR